jgi:MFS family permease
VSSSLPCAEATPFGGSRFIARVRSWWLVETLGRQFWIFFTAALLFDFGVGLYFFLFNLFLLNMHFDERTMGMITAALTLGNVAGTVPVSIMARRFGLQKLLLFCFIAAPTLSICRTLTIWMPAQIGLALLTGVALSSWPVCFAPAIAGLTYESNRVFAFSIAFATGIGTGAFAGFAGGFLPRMLQRAHVVSHPTDGMRLILVAASLVAMLGVWPVSILRLGTPQPPQREKHLLIPPYLRRFLPAFAIWSIVTGSFIPFAPVFFQKKVGMSLEHVGEVFAASQLAQFCAVLIAPLLYRKAGSVVGIIYAQVASAGLIIALGCSRSTSFAITCYLAYTAVQFTAGPGFYGTLMSRVPEADRSTASAMQNIVGALAQAGSAALTGIVVVRFGYGLVFNANAILAAFAALMVFTCIASNRVCSGMQVHERANACTPAGETRSAPTILLE